MGNDKFKIGKRDRVTVTIERRRREASEIVPYRRKAFYKKRGEPDYLPRRRRAPGHIRFFDLGRLASGDDINTTIYQPDFPYVYPENPSAPSADIDAYDALDTAINDVVGGIENLETTFYEIKQADGDFYNLHFVGSDVDELLTSDNENWTENGFKFTDAQLESSDFGFAPDDGFGWRWKLFPAIQTSGTGAAKVTATDDFEADAVENFKLKKGDKIFIYPRLNFYKGQAGMIPNDDDIGDLTHYIFWDFKTSRRAFYIGDLSPSIDPQDFSWSMTFSTADPDYPQHYEIMMELIDLFGTTRAWRAGYDFNLEDYIFGTMSGSNFLPDPPFHPDAPTFAFNTSFGLEAVPQNPVAGAKLAIIKRGSQFYYIWQTD